MKIDKTDSVQMLQKGVFENSDKRIREQESKRIKTALETEKTIKTFKDTRGINFDAKA